MPERLRVGIVGAGYFGRFHLDAWSRIPEVEIAAIVERDPARGAEAAALVGGPPVFSDAAEMMRAVGPEIVDITAPPAAHLPTIRAVAPFAPWIVCQKPFCGGLEAAREAVALAADQGARLAVHENIRFQPWHREARRLIEAGALGEVMQATFRLRPGDGRGEDAYLARQPYFRDMPRFLVHETAIHWIDLFRCLLGEPAGAYAHLTRLNPVIAGEDAGVILFDMASGARALFDGNRLADHAAENTRRTLGEMWIEGTAATLRLDGDGRLWLRHFGERAEAEHRFAWRDHGFGGDCVFLCTRAILDAWREDRAPETEAAGYLRNLEIEAAVYESAAAGRHLPLR